MFQNTRQSDSAQYKFGDSDIAAERLATVAEVFEPSSAEFLRRSVLPGIRLAVDLGCGPGHSTRLIAAAAPGCRVVGLDSSDSFLARAAGGGQAGGVEFLRHDVRATPLPVQAPDLIYSRLLLAHLRDPQTVVARWAAELAPSGRLLLEEVENIASDHPVAADYQSVVDGMLARHGQRIQIGCALSLMDDPPGTTGREDRLVTVRPASRQVGRMFALNLRAWSADPYVTATFAADWLNRLQQRLDEAADGRYELPVEWTMRQILFMT
jgi:SAM-dependent methyltransferase